MPEIQYASAAPGIAMFNANMTQGDAQRRQAEEDAIRRVQFEQSQSADAAQRLAAAGYFAPPGAAAPGTQAAPVQTPTQVPNPAATTPVVTPNPSLLAVDNPDTGGVPARAAPAPNMPPRAGVDVPATVQGPPAIAAFSAQPQAAAARPGQDRFGEMAKTLAGTPGTGAQLMNMVGTSMTADRAHETQLAKNRVEANKEIIGYLRDGDIDMARVTANTHGIQIPDEVWNNKNMVMQMRVGANIAKTSGIKDEHAVHFMQGYMEGISGGLQPGEAARKALSAMPKDTFELKHVEADAGGNAIGVDKTGQTKDLGFKMRQPRGALEGGRPSATIQNRDDMAKRIKTAYPGADDQFIQRLIVNPHSQATSADILRTEANVRRLTNNGVPVYKTEAEVKQVATQTVRDAAKAAESMTRSSAAGDTAEDKGGDNDPLGIRKK